MKQSLVLRVSQAMLAGTLLSGTNLYAQPDIPLTHHSPVRSPSGDIIYGDVRVGVGFHRGAKTMRADFTFRPGFGALDDDYDFWWFQIVHDPWPLNDRDGNRLNSPYVDPPRGGYQDQPDDELPYYWNRDEFNRANTHVEREFSRIWDRPNAPEKRDEPGEVLFKTFLVITYHGQDSFGQPNVFGKVLGFSWAIGSRRRPNGTLENYAEFREWLDIRREKQDIQNAFNNSGFGNWQTIQVPEPASLIALAVGLVGVTYRRRQRAI